MITGVDQEKCVGCGLCVEICPLDVLRLGASGKACIAYPEDCMTCYECELGCAYEAIDVHPFKEVLPLAIEYPERKARHG